MNAGAALRRFALDRSSRRVGGGRVLIGGSPLRVLQLTEGGAALVDALERSGSEGEAVEVRTGAMSRLVDRLVDIGVVHPLAAAPDDDHRWRREVTLVTPCKDELPRHPDWQARSIVVDDGSMPPLAMPPSGRSPDAADEPDAPGDGRAARRRSIRLDRNAGPAAARNAGLAEVTTPLVAFVDADVEIDEEALASLVHWFDDPRVALVAPRVRAFAAPGALAAFEAVRSPLDLGDEPARVSATTRVSYVPAAALVCRTEALRSIGGFDESLRYGEDVDLVWRLGSAGWRCRYDPSVTAFHRTRPTLRSWVLQRFRYGTSAAPLARRHPGALAPLRMSGWSAATWVPVAAGVPLLGALVGVATSVALVRKLPQVPPRESFRLAALGNLFAGRLWCETLSRAWWPVAAVGAITSRRLRRVAFAAWVVPIVADARGARRGGGTSGRRRLDPVRYALLHLLDDAAYGAGVWVGAWRERSAAALLPSFEAWPPRHDAARAGGSGAGGAEVA